MNLRSEDFWGGLLAYCEFRDWPHREKRNDVTYHRHRQNLSTFSACVNSFTQMPTIMKEGYVDSPLPPVTTGKAKFTTKWVALDLRTNSGQMSKEPMNP